MEAQRSDILPKITQLTYGSTESVGNLPKITQLKYGSMGRSGSLPKISQLRFGGTERSDFLTKITQFLSGNTERLGNLLKLHSSCMKAQRGQATCLDPIVQKWKKRERSDSLPKIKQPRNGRT